jgi:hypothetical protein
LVSGFFSPLFMMFSSIDCGRVAMVVSARLRNFISPIVRSRNSVINNLLSVVELPAAVECYGAKPAAQQLSSSRIVMPI